MYGNGLMGEPKFFDTLAILTMLHPYRKLGEVLYIPTRSTLHSPSGRKLNL